MTTLEDGVVINESLNAAFFTKAADAGNPTKTEIAIHWWGKKQDGTLMTDIQVTLDTFCNGGKETSAHFVVEAGKVYCLVDPDDVAWAVGDWNGNLRSISIECNPRGWDSDYAEIANVIKYIRGIYGDLPLYPHNHYVATECPGTYDLARLDALARGINHDGGTAMADVTTEVDRFNDYGQPDGSKTSVIKEAQWAKANKDFIVNTIKAEIDAAKNDIIVAIQAAAAGDKA